MNMIKVEAADDGKFKITYNLTTVWVTADEALAAASNQNAANDLFRRIASMREGR